MTRRPVPVMLAVAVALLMGAGGVLVGTGDASATSAGVERAAPSTNGATSVAGQQPSGSATSGAPVVVGVTGVDYSGFFKQVGVNSANQPQFVGFRNLFRYMNSHGGLDGHPIEADYHTINGAANSYADESESACADFTQDHHVQVVLAVGVTFAFEDFTSCLAHHGIAQIDTSQWSFDEQGMADHRNLFMPTGMGEDRYAATELNVALRHGWLSRKDTLGVLYMDCPLENRVYNGVIERVARQHHITVVGANIQCFSGFQDVSTDSTEIQSSILKFKSRGVTTVAALTASEGTVLSAFVSNASKQDYHPRYLLTSNAFPYANTSAGLWPKDQLQHMSGAGWEPLIDVGPKAEPLPAQSICKQMDPTLGDTKGVTTNQETFYDMCDGVRILDDMVTRDGGKLTVAALTSAYRAVAPSFASAVVPKGQISAAHGRRDGAALVVPFSYGSACKCWSNAGPPTPAVQG